MRTLASIARRWSGAAVGGALTLAAQGCAVKYVMIQTGQFPEPMIFEDALEWTREGSEAVSTMHDFEAAMELAYGGIGQLEGLHRLVPDNKDGLFLLNRSWASIAIAFIDDEREQALQRKDDRMAAYHTDRARAAFRRARFYGEELVGLRTTGYEEAQRNVDTLRAWLEKSYPDPALAQELLWLGLSIVGTVSYDADNPEAVADLWVGVQVLEHVLRLDDEVDNGTAHTVLAAYHARSALAELDEAKKHFDRVLEITEGRSLMAKVNLAQRYHCFKRDKASYVKTLEEVLEAGDVWPDQRLPNTIAKRRARRYLSNEYWQEDCAFDA